MESFKQVMSLPRTQRMLLYEIASAVQGKRRFCDREGHIQNTYKIGGMVYVSVCPKCLEDLKGRFEAKAERLNIKEKLEVIQIG